MQLLRALPLLLLPVAAVAGPGKSTSAKGGTPPTQAETPPPPPPPAGLPAPSDVAAPPADARVTASGLAYKPLRPADPALDVLGAGTHPAANSRVTVHYTGWTTDGQMFDSSVERGEPATFPLNGVIPGWTEGVQLMVPGELYRFWIPSKLAYDGAPGAPRGMLVFDIELLGFITPPPTPLDLTRPPPTATTTATGLIHKQLQAGTGTVHPGPESTVTVHYSGWTADGQLIDSSVVRNQPLTTRLDQVIAGWQEGVQLMVEGEKRRFWIPAYLAYGNRRGAPGGTLYFEIELVRIEP
jgi:peptidylprolyl isomerase